MHDTARCSLFVALGLALAAAPLAGCSSRTNQGARGSLLQPRDYNTSFNPEDAQGVFEDMVDDCLSKAWLDNFNDQNERDPKLFVGVINTDPRDQIETELFTRPIEEELVNSGRVVVLASPEQRDTLRQERIDMQVFTRESDVKAVANELGADYIMLGKVSNYTARDGAARVYFYQVVLELLDIESGQKVWIQTERIKKRSTPTT